MQPPSRVVADFLAGYEKEYDYYEAAARLCADRCEALLGPSGIRAIITYRAKKTASLQRKVLSRHAVRPFAQVESVYQEIADLAGVRIALYFPGDLEEVGRLIRESFAIDSVREFRGSEPVQASTYERRFPGYCATHYRVRLRAEDLGSLHERFAQARVEVQVASVLMHAWAEVEHDLVYKPSSGQLSRAEQAILDEINGLVLAGEIALQNLQAAVADRVRGDGRKFGNHFELAAYLYDCARSKAGECGGEPLMGRADVLFQLLRGASLDRPKDLYPYLDCVDVAASTQPIADQVADAIIAGNPELYRLLQTARASIGGRNPYDAAVDDGGGSGVDAGLRLFVALWIAFERGVRVLQESMPYRPPSSWSEYNVHRREPITTFSESEWEQVAWLKALRNRLVHGTEVPDPETVDRANGVLRELLLRVVAAKPAEAGTAALAVLRQLEPEMAERLQDARGAQSGG
jgi:ppGpp synthetase/RelA/SpoT-type nucleotidyltranferase